MRKYRVWLPLAAVIVAIAAAGPMTVARGAATGRGGEGARIETLEPKDALALIQKNRGNEEFVILDVRTPEEFRDGHLERAINLDQNAGELRGGLPDLDKNKTYLVYCRTGRRTTAAIELMVQQGFKKIYRLSGDITRWRSEGLPLVKEPSPVPPRSAK